MYQHKTATKYVFNIFQYRREDRFFTRMEFIENQEIRQPSICSAKRRQRHRQPVEFSARRTEFGVATIRRWCTVSRTNTSWYPNSIKRLKSYTLRHIHLAGGLVPSTGGKETWSSRTVQVRWPRWPRCKGDDSDPETDQLNTTLCFSRLVLTKSSTHVHALSYWMLRIIRLCHNKVKHIIIIK